MLAFLGTGLDKGGRVISSFFLARVLSDEDFGIFLLTLATLNTIGLIVAAGLQAAATHFISSALSKGRDEFSRTFWSLAILSGTIAVGIVVIGSTLDMKWVAEKVFAASKLGPLLRIGVPIAAFLVLSYCAEGILQGLRHFGLVTVTKAVAMPLMIAAAVGLGIAFGVRGAVMGLVVGGFLLFALLSVQVARAARRSELRAIMPSPGKLCSIARMSAMLSLATITVGLTVCLGQVILTRNRGFDEVGLFGVGNQLRNLMALVSATLGAATLPFLSACSSSGERTGFRVIGTEYSLLLFAVVGPMCVIMIGLSREVLSLCYGAGKAHAWSGANLLFWAQLLLLPGLAMRCVAIALAEPVMSVLVNVFWAVVYLLAAWLLTARFGYVGLATATLLGSLAVTPVSVAYLIRRRAVDLRVVLRSFAVLVACAACAEALARNASTGLRWGFTPLLAASALAFVWYKGFDSSARLRVRAQFAAMMKRGA